MRYKHRSNWRFFLAASAGVMVAGSVSPLIPYAQGNGQAISFSDVAHNDYYYQAVSSLSERGIIKGYGNGIFKPNESVTRAQAAKMLALALNIKTDQVKDPGFKDVSKNNWAYSYIAALTAQGIMTGYGDQFKPDEPITRAQMAKVIALGYKFNTSPLKDKRFNDVNPKDWYAGYLQPLIEKGITNGTTAKTYSPNEKVSRGQMAAFIYRSEIAAKPVQVTAAVSSITDQAVITDKGVFSLSASLKTWFNADNLAALKGANITFIPNGDKIEKFTSVELTASGQAGSNTKLTLDGKGALIQTDLIVNGDFTILKNMKVKGNLEIGNRVKQSFYAEQVSVEGKTIVADEENSALVNSDKVYNSISYKIAAQNRNEAKADAIDPSTASRIVFHNSSLGALEITKGNTIVEATGETKADSVMIRSKTKFTADSQTVIPKLTIEAGVESVEINSNVEEIRIIGNGNVTVSGNASFGQMVASAASIVRVESTGQVGLLKTVDKDSRFILGSYTKIGDLQLPTGMNPADAIPNYESVKGNIEKIGGNENPGYSGGTVVIPNTAPVVSAEVLDQNLTAGNAPFSIDLSSVFADPNGDSLQLSAASSMAEIANADVHGTNLLISPVNPGTSTITVTADDGRGGIVYETFIVTVEQPNRIPAVANEIADRMAVAGDAPITVELSSVFTDADNDVLTVTADSSNSGVAGASVTGTTLTLTPSAPGITTITVKAEDRRGGTVEESFTVTVEQPNRAPAVVKELTDKTAAAGEAPFLFDLTQIFRDADGDALTLTASSSDSVVAEAEIFGSDLIVTLGSAGTATITVKADDGRGEITEESFTVTVEQPNRAPVVARGISDQKVMFGGPPIPLDLSQVFNDDDGDSLTLTASSSDSGIATVDVLDSELKITLLRAGTSTITVKANDGRGGMVEESFTVTAEPPNHAPVVKNEIVNQTVMAGDSPFTVDLSNVFGDVDEDPFTLTTVTSNSGVATAEVTGTNLKLTPLNAGTATITVKAEDGRGGTVEESFTITVEQLNHAPVVENEIANQTALAGDAPFTVGLSNVFEDVDGDALTLTTVTSNSGVATAEVTGTNLKLTPLNAGTATITVKAEDGRGGTVEESFTITVEPPNHAPVVKNEILDQTALAGDAPFAVDLSNVFGDDDGGALTLTAVTSDSGVATAEVAGTNLKLTPLNAGTATITVKAEDGRGGTVEESFTVTVEQLNHAPVVVNEIQGQTATVGGPITIDIKNVFSDGDNDQLSLTAVSSDPGVSTVNITGNTLSISPVNAGTATVTLTAADGRGGTVSSSFELTVQSASEEAPPSLFISEALWNGTDLALELYNPTNTTVDLSQLKLVLPYKVIGFETLGLTLEPGKLLVIANEWFYMDEISFDMVSVPFEFDTDSEVELDIQLKFGEHIIDSIKFIKDKTMLRQSGVTQGTATYDDSQWVDYPVGNLDYIGTHDPTPAP